MTIPLALLLLAALVAVLVLSRGGKSLADEERELRDYFRHKDAAERRGEDYPPHESPGGRLF